MRTEEDAFTLSSAVPYTCNTTRNERTEYESPTNTKTVIARHIFDDYGNVVQTKTYGEGDTTTVVNNDKSTTWHTFINNPDLFITACKMREVTRPGIANATLDPLAETRYFYINALDQVAYGEPPKICEPVRQRAYDMLTTYVEWNWTYDNYGNRDSETDPEE